MPKCVNAAKMRYLTFGLRTMPEQPAVEVTIFNHTRAAIAP
ncbi:MAG: hypothetical protein ACQCN5_08535 [Candidatus Bathyarchaeia archaeon]